MIDITPRNQNYTSTMASTNFERQENSPPHHSSSYQRDRELNDAEGKYSTILFVYAKYKIMWLTISTYLSFYLNAFFWGKNKQNYL